MVALLVPDDPHVFRIQKHVAPNHGRLAFGAYLSEERCHKDTHFSLIFLSALIGVNFIAAQMDVFCIGVDVVKLPTNSGKQLLHFAAFGVPAPAVRRKEGGQTGILVEHHMLAAADTAGRSVPQMVQHGDGLHAHFPNLPGHIFGKGLVEGLRPSQLLEAVIPERSPVFQHHMGVLHDAGQAQVFFKNRAVVSGNTQMWIIRFSMVYWLSRQQVPIRKVSLPGSSYRVDVLHQHHEPTGQTAIVPTRHCQTIQGDADGKFLSLRNRGELHPGCPEGVLFARAPDERCGVCAKSPPQLPDGFVVQPAVCLNRQLILKIKVFILHGSFRLRFH